MLLFVQPLSRRIFGDRCCRVSKVVKIALISIWGPEEARIHAVLFIISRRIAEGTILHIFNSGAFSTAQIAASLNVNSFGGFKNPES